MLLFLSTRPGSCFLSQAATSAWPAAAAGPGQVAVCLLFLIARLMEHETTAGGLGLPAALISPGHSRRWRRGPAGGPGSGVLPHCSWPPAPDRALGKADIGKPEEGVRWEHPCPHPALACAALGPALHTQGEQRRLGASVSLFHQISRSRLSPRESSRGALLMSSHLGWPLVLGLVWRSSDLFLTACRTQNTIRGAQDLL